MLVLDISGSMGHLYKNGTVQDVVERILALTSKFDDDGVMFTFLYDHSWRQIENATESNYINFVQREILSKPELATFGGNNEPLIMRELLAGVSTDYTESEAHKQYTKYLNEKTVIYPNINRENTGSSMFGKVKSFFGVNTKTTNNDTVIDITPKIDKSEDVSGHKDKNPNFIVFISDGGCETDRRLDYTTTNTILGQDTMRNVIVESSKYNIFWQFVGIGNSDYGVLQKLDSITEGYIDNANFICLDNIKNISDEVLYDKLLNEFPSWLKLAKEKNIII